MVKSSNIVYDKNFDKKVVNVIKADIYEGFSSADLNLTLITDVELFNRKIKKPTIAKKLSKREDMEFIYSINDLAENDLVVHSLHGIGRYLGLTQQEIDGELRDKILAAIDIEKVVSEDVTLKRSGANYRGLCPFHTDKTPSLYVSKAKGIWKCFVCGEGGDAIKWVAKINDISYYEAARMLAKQANIEFPENQLTDEELLLQRERIGKSCDECSARTLRR